MSAYDTLAGVYDWLVPDALLSPQGSVAAFAGTVGLLPSGARVFDCACGTGQLAVGLALSGFEVVAADASPAMVRRTRGLAAEHGVELEAMTCAWEDIPARGLRGFDAIFCVGNSVTHAEGRVARRAAIRAMAGALREDGALVVTSRNWDLVRRAGSRVDIAERLVERAGRAALVVHAWSIADTADEPHTLEVAVVLISDSEVATHRERLRFWPFTHEELDDDLRAAGLTPASSTFAPDVERYMVTAVLRSEPGLDRG